MFPTSDFFYDKKNKAMTCKMSTLGLNRFPRSITIKSDYTGREILFVYDGEAAERNEGWDGELAEYVSVGDIKVKRLVLIND
jgi:hypothetical protein